MDSADPIDVAEAENHARYVRAALLAESDEERRAALGEGLLLFGTRFAHTLSILTEQEVQSPNRFAPLRDEAAELFTSWATGTRLTDRADEDERRAAMMAEFAEENPAIGAIAADAILALDEGNPKRDLARVRTLMERYVEAGDGEPDTELRAINVLFEVEPTDAELEELLARGAQLEPSVEDEGVSRSFHAIAAGACLLRATRARDDDEDVEAQHAWARRGIDVLGPPSPATLSLLAALYSLLDDDRTAAETLARAAADPTLRDEVRQDAAMFEARFRSGLGEHARVVEILEPLLAIFEERYLTAVTAEAIDSAGRGLGDAVINLAFALARLGRWSEALGVLDRGRSLRARYRAALRRSEAGADLLALERDLYRVERGAGGGEAPEQWRDEDRLAEAVQPRTRLLEAYRRLRPRLPAETVRGPSVADLAGVLGADEAAVVLGVTSSELLMAAVVTSDAEAPAFARVLDFPAERWMGVLVADEGGGWLTGIESGAERAELSAALAAVVALAGEALGDLPAQLAGRGVRRLVVIAHRWLHLVPWWAVPALDGFEVVQTAPSAADLVAARRAPTPPLGDRALVVANPTGDLRAAPAEAAAVDRRLTALGIACSRLDGAGATEEAVLGAMRKGPGILHFCGHGSSDLVRPDRSALLLHPHVDVRAGDPFEPWAAAVTSWEDHEDGRAGEVPGVGRLVEEDADGARIRRLEHGDTGTLWGQYDGDRLVRLAELWTAGDMLVGDALDGCSLAVLSACESGSGSLGVEKIDEAAGLPAAMALAGAATVVGTLWPVGDALGALFVDMLYARLAEPREGDTDLAALVHATRTELRTLAREAAVAAIDGLRAETTDPIARFTLEAFREDVAARPGAPFADPYDWAPFFTTGTGRVRAPVEAAA